MITVTGATGQLGRLVIEDLIARGVPAGEIVAAVRTPDKAAELAARGVQVRAADYSQPDTLPAAFAGTDKLLLISSNEVGQRTVQHRNVIDAAKAAGASLLAYTSVLRADTSSTPVAAEHKATEEAIRASGLPFVFLRNGWYIENYTANLAPALERGVLPGAAQDGRIGAATRADYAAAAAAVLTSDGHAGTVYELVGDEPFTMAELAAEVSRQAGKEVAYQDLPVAEYAKALADAGLPVALVDFLSATDVSIARGDLDSDSRDLHRLIGRATTSLADAVAAAVKA